MPPKKNGDATVYLLTERTLSGDLRDAMLEIIKRMKKPWQKMSEAEQRDTIDQVRVHSIGLVSDAVALIAAAERPAIVCRVEKVAIDDKGAKLSLAGISAVTGQSVIAAHLQGKRIVLVEATTEAYEGERAPARPDPDQKELIAKEEAAGAA